MNNEPVAWMVDGVLFTSLGAALNISFDIEQPCIPLYTHPVKKLTDRIAELEKQLDTRTRELIGASFYEHDYKTLMAKPPLTDEEIEEIGKQYLSAHAQFIGAGECHYEGEIDFARAILRKAQEK